MSSNFEESLRDLRNLVESNHLAFQRHAQTSRDYREMFVHVGARMERIETHLANNRAGHFHAIQPQIFTRHEERRLRRIRERLQQSVQQGGQAAPNPAAAPQTNGPFPTSPSLLAGTSAANVGSAQPMPTGSNSGAILAVALLRKMKGAIENGEMVGCQVCGFGLVRDVCSNCNENRLRNELLAKLGFINEPLLSLSQKLKEAEEKLKSSAVEAAVSGMRENDGASTSAATTNSTDEKVCGICTIQEADTVLLGPNGRRPCGHVVCSECAKAIVRIRIVEGARIGGTCPTCRAPITRFQKIFF